MSSAERIARAVLETHASVYHVCATPHQQDRVIESATRQVDTLIAELIREALAKVPLNPT